MGIFSIFKEENYFTELPPDCAEASIRSASLQIDSETLDEIVKGHLRITMQNSNGELFAVVDVGKSYKFKRLSRYQNLKNQQYSSETT